jgi:hypothetical protein
MPFLTQPSPFPGLELAPPMASITVEAGDFKKMHKYHILILSVVSIPFAKQVLLFNRVY